MTPALTPEQDRFADAINTAIADTVDAYGHLSANDRSAVLVSVACCIAAELCPNAAGHIAFVLEGLKRHHESRDAMVKQGVHPRIADRIALLKESAPDRPLILRR